MATNIANAAIGAGLAAGGQAGSSAQQANRAEARAAKEASDQKLTRLQATKPNGKDLSNLADIQSLEIENLKAQQQQTLRQNNERRSYTGFERYDKTGEVRHLNNVFTDLKASGSKLYNDIVRVDNLTEADSDIITARGNVDHNKVINDPDVSGSYVKATMADGTTQVLNMDDLKGRTRYNKYAATEELERQKTSKEILMLDAIGYDTTPRGREAFRRARNSVGDGVDPKSPEFQDAYTKFYTEVGAEDNLHKGRGSRGESLTEKEAEAKRRTEIQGLSPGQPGYTEAFSQNMSDVNTEWQRPSPVRQEEAADVVREQLNELDILGKPYTEMTLKERAKIEPLISKLERFSDSKLTTADKATLQRINELTDLGGKASELTDEQTGFIDRIFRTVSKYISDNTEGVAQEAAYAGYRNVVRNALFGSVLTPGETKAFTQQFGSLGEQRGPILAQLKVSLEQLKSQYDTLVQTNDPYVIAYRTGKTANELQDVMEALDERIDMVGNAMSGKTVVNPNLTRPSQATTRTQAKDTTLTPERRARLDQLRGVGQ